MNGSYLFFGLLYFLPALIAICRRYRHRRALFFANVLLGWTGVGWLVLLALSLGGYPGISPPSTEVPLRPCPPVLAHLQALAAKTSGELHQFSAQAAAQFGIFESQVERFIAILEHKFTPHELACQRYRDVVTQLQEAVDGNFSVIGSLLDTLHSLNRPYLLKRLQALQPINELDGVERDALQERSLLYDEQKHKVEILLSQNERAITALSKLSSRIAQINLVNGRIPAEAGPALHDIEELLARAAHYDRQPLAWRDERAVQKKG